MFRFAARTRSYCKFLIFFWMHVSCLSMAVGQGVPRKPNSPKSSVLRSPLDPWIDAAIARAKLQRDAKAALDVLDEVLQSSELNDAQKKKLSAERDKFKEYKDKALVRNGQTWVTVEEESPRITLADQLIERGMTFVRLEDDKSAKEAFEEASQTDQNGVRADFILGMMNSPLVAFTPKIAAEHFKEVLKRSPQLPSAMNNLALSLVRQGEFSDALRIWKELDRQEPGSDLVLYNVTKLVHDIRDGRLVPTKLVTKSIEKFYVDLVSGTSSDSKIKPIGWRYANLTLPRSEEDRTRFDESSVLAKADVLSGFVIQSGYVVTALQCVRDYNTISVVFSNGDVFEASLDSSSELHNVAVLKIPRNNIPAVSVETAVPDKQSKLYQFAYPGFQSDRPVMESREVMFSAVTPPLGTDCFVFDGRRKRGYVGAPVCDESGNVLGMTTSISTLDSGLTPTVSISHVLSHVKRNIPAFEEPQQSKIVFDDVQKIIARTGGSVCQIVVSKKYHRFGIGTSDDPRYVLDRKSSCCGGTGRVSCPAKGCNNGQVSVKRKVVVGQNPIAGEITGQKVLNQDCTRCNGTGKVSCPFKCPIRK